MNIKKKTTLKKNKIVLLAYGYMASAAFNSLKRLFHIDFIVTPPLNLLNFRNDKKMEVERLAEKERVKIFRPKTNGELEIAIRSVKPDALVICSYNKILPKSILALTKCINVHHGDLPNWRGRANFNWAIIKGRSSVGLTIHDATAELDAGNIFAQYIIPINSNETIASLYSKANNITEKKLGDIVKKVIEGFRGTPQRGVGTYCCTRLPEDGYIDWSSSSLDIDRLIRALTKPFPGAFTYYKGEKMIIWSAEIPSVSPNYVCRIPGRIIKIHKGIGIEVLTRDSSIIFKEVSFRNKNGNADNFVNTINASLGLNDVEIFELLKKSLK